MKVTIDQEAGFCFGVKQAIENAEKYLDMHDTLYCLGEIVHNEKEVERLANRGLVTIDREHYKTLKNTTVLLRAHGEPSETYHIAEKNNITLIDATCPLVLRLQKKIKVVAETTLEPQIIVYGKPSHPEIIGLKAQAPEKVIVVNDFSDLNQVDFTKPVKLYSQTTKDKTKLLALKTEIQHRIDTVSGPDLEFNDTICRQVHNRNDSLKKFCKKHQVVVFVGGKKSSNAKVLFNICKTANYNSFFVSSEKEINYEWFQQADSVGISGATSTPRWLLERVKNVIEEH